MKIRWRFSNPFDKTDEGKKKKSDSRDDNAALSGAIDPYDPVPFCHDGGLGSRRSYVVPASVLGSSVNQFPLIGSAVTIFDG